jgi:membrane protease YdiL (CAAX protease family)
MGLEVESCSGWSAIRGKCWGLSAGNTPETTRPAPVLGRVALFWAGYVGILFLASFFKAMVPVQLSQLVWGLISGIGILALTLIFLKREGRRPRDIGLDIQGSSVGRFLAGILIGWATYGLMILAISAVAGPIHFNREAPPDTGVALLMVASFLALSTMEELGFRGYPLRTLVSALGQWRAQALVALAFALSHVIFGWSWQTVVFGVLPNAVLFGVVALASGGLAMPIGLHAALNIGRWATGETETPGIWSMAVEGQGSPWLPSFIGMVVTTLATMLVWGWYRRRASD